jgi:mersacidin/lichenicidin family type 2 lantibiotic
MLNWFSFHHFFLREVANMPKIDIIRAWKDEEYRASLTDAERAQLPAHPAGLIELEDAELNTVVGGSHAGGCGTGFCTVTYPKCCVTA